LRAFAETGHDDTAAWARAEGVLDGEPPDFLKQKLRRDLTRRHWHYDTVVAKLATMRTHEPTVTRDDLGKIACRTLVMVADDEVRLEHAIEMYRSLPDAELAIVPGTSHGLLVEKPDLCNLLITEFLTKDPFRRSRDPPRCVPGIVSAASPLQDGSRRHAHRIRASVSRTRDQGGVLAGVTRCHGWRADRVRLP
jgi:hypothetical protein